MTEVEKYWQANLIILGKLERGDMLAVAGDDGKLVRKTNWLTQATNNSKTRGEELFTQIKTVLDTAETNIDKNPEDVLIEQYVKANKGLEILLSTYKSKGSKETELIGKLSLVLAQHMVTMENNNVKVILKPQELKKHAEQAIQFVNDCRIRSVNNVLKNGGLGNSYFGQEFDEDIFRKIVRCASIVQKQSSNTVINHVHKKIKAILATIMIMPCSRKEKREIFYKELDSVINNSKGQPHWLDAQDIWETKKYHFETQPEALRIKLVKNTIRHRIGNCGDKSCVVATHLAENTKGDIGISIIQGKSYDHAWVLISKEKEKLEAACKKLETPENGNYKHLFPHDTWVVDGWTRDWWQLRAWTNSMGNPRQLRVRTKIRKAIISGEFNLNEIVTWPPKYPYEGFRLRFAHLVSLDKDIINSNIKDMPFSNDWQKAVLVLQTMKYELSALGFLAEYFP